MSRYDQDVLDELDIALEDDVAVEFSGGKQGNLVAQHFAADHRATRTIREMKDLMRATADLLEMEAARLRHELELLDMTADHATLH
jgi:hypothetical protein